MTSSPHSLTDVCVRWGGGDAELLSHADALTPMWRLLLLGDGSPTRNLHMISGSVS